MKRNSEKLISAINDRGEDWRREIDNIIKELKSGIEKTESEHIVFLQKQEDEINRSISEMSQTIGELKKLKDSNDVSLFVSTNPEMQNLGKCHQSSSLPYQAFRFQKSTQNN